MPLNKAAAKVGIIADNLLQQHLLKSALINFGFNVVLTTDPDRLGDNSDLVAEVDAWVVDIADDEGDHFEWLDTLFEGDLPVLFGMGVAPQRN